MQFVPKSSFHLLIRYVELNYVRHSLELSQPRPYHFPDLVEIWIRQTVSKKQGRSRDQHRGEMSCNNWIAGQKFIVVSLRYNYVFFMPQITVHFDDTGRGPACMKGQLQLADE